MLTKHLSLMQAPTHTAAYAIEVHNDRSSGSAVYSPFNGKREISALKKFLTLALALMTLALMGTEVIAQTRTIILNTGYDQWSAPPARIDVGKLDNEWRVISDTINGAPQPPPATGRPADVVSDDGWNANPLLAINFPNSRWISIKPNQGTPLPFPLPSNKFQYAFYFTLPVGFSSPVLTMKLSADDRITKVTLNSTTLFQGSGGIFNGPPLAISVLTASGFNSGATVNVITVEVEDTGAIITGLIVDGSVTYEDCARLPIKDIHGLTSITFWESTVAAPTQHTFLKGDSRLASQIGTLGPLNDFEGVTGAELYDVFYSAWDGTPDPSGQFVTIEAVWNVGAPSGGGLNIARVDFNGTGQFANSVSSFVALGDNAMPNDVGKSVDGLTSTDTTMGNTIGQPQRLRVTVGIPCPSLPMFGTITGRVSDRQNRPVRGTLVQAPGRMPIRTTPNGSFTIDNLALTERLAISFSAPGFVDTTRVFPVRPGVLNVSETVLLRRAPAVVINATNGGRVTFASGGGLTIPPRSLFDSVGNPLTGDVRVSLTYLDVSDPKQIRSAPGDFTATMRDNSVRTLESFGIFEAYVEDLRGRRADLAPGKTAIINLPIPRRNLGNVPRTIGLFSFATISGRWIEAGTLIRSNDGLTYNGTINTLDVNWNGDDPVDTTCIRVQVFEPHFPNPPHGPPAVNSHVTAAGVSYNGSSDGYTDSNGFVCLLVKRNSQVSLQAFSTQVSSYVSVPIVITTPNIASGAADCGNLAKCPLAQEIDLDIIVGLPHVNFYDFKAGKERQFTKLRAELGERFDIEEGTGYGQYQAWVGHWEPLVYPHGRFEIAYDAMNRIARQPDLPTPPPQPPYCNAWKELGPFDTPVGDSGRGVGQVHWVDFDPNNADNLFTGSAIGGLFYSTDAGATWQSGGTDFLEPNIGAAHVAVDPKDATGSTWLLATGDGDGHPMDGVGSGQNTSHGVYLTTDKGKRWLKIGLDFTNDWRHVPVWWTFQIKKLLFAPDNSGTIWAATNFGLFKTTIAKDPSGFDDWELVPTGENNGNPANDDPFYDIEYKPGDPDTLYASGSTLVRSLDGGETWNPLPGIPFLPDSDAGRIAMEVTPAKPDYLYVVVVTRDPAECNGIADDVPRSWLYRFDANSGSWTDKGPICNTGSYEPTQRGVHFSRAQSIGVSPIDADLIFIGDVKMAKCTTGGDPNFCNWIQTASTVHDDIHQVKFAPIDANNPNGLTIYAAHDGGVSKTVNGGINWTPQSNGLAVAWVMRMSTSATDRKLILAGLFDEGTVLYNGSTWRQVFGGDGLTPIIDHIDPTNMFVSRQSGHVRRSADKGVSFPFFANPGCASNWHTFVILNSVDTQTIFGACLPEVVRSPKRGEPRTWSTISDFTSDGLGDLQVWKLYTALSDPDILYAHLVGAEKQLLYRTERANDPNPQWTSILLPSNRWISDIYVDEVDPNKFWLTYTGSPNKVHYYNGNAFINLTTSLDPGLTVNSIVHRRGTDQLFIGTNRGVYSGRGAAPNWTRLGTPTVGEMPFIEVGDIEINYVNNKLRAATRGRGVWEIPLDPCLQTEICVMKFVDKNGNGVQDTGEQGLPGWTFQIKDALGDIVATITTGGPKKPCAIVPAPETYAISEVLQPGWISTTPNPKTVTVSAGNPVNVSFGNKIICPSITLNPAAGALPTTEFGSSYSQTITATGGCASSFTYSVTSGVVPPGLTLGANGVLSGTTSQWGTFDFTVTATDSCGCSQSQNYTLTVLPDWDRFRRGMNEYCIWGGGGGSYNSPSQIDYVNSQVGINSPTQSGVNRGTRYGAIGLCYGRILLANDRFAFKYTFNAIPATVLSYRDVNLNLGIPVPVSETRRNVFGAGLSPIGLQLYFRPQSRIKPFVNISGGFIVFNDQVPRLNGARFNFTYDFGGGVQVFRNSRRAFTFGYKYQNISNGGRALNNPGFDAHVFYFGYSIFNARKIAPSP